MVQFKEHFGGKLIVSIQGCDFLAVERAYSIID